MTRLDQLITIAINSGGNSTDTSKTVAAAINRTVASLLPRAANLVRVVEPRTILDKVNNSIIDWYKLKGKRPTSGPTDADTGYVTITADSPSQGIIDGTIGMVPIDVQGHVAVGSRVPFLTINGIRKVVGPQLKRTGSLDSDEDNNIDYKVMYNSTVHKAYEAATKTDVAKLPTEIKSQFTFLQSAPTISLGVGYGQIIGKDFIEYTKTGETVVERRRISLSQHLDDLCTIGKMILYKNCVLVQINRYDDATAFARPYLKQPRLWSCDLDQENYEGNTIVSDLLIIQRATNNVIIVTGEQVDSGFQQLHSGFVDFYVDRNNHLIVARTYGVEHAALTVNGLISRRGQSIVTHSEDVIPSDNVYTYELDGLRLAIEVYNLDGSQLSKLYTAYDGPATVESVHGIAVTGGYTGAVLADNELSTDEIYVFRRIEAYKQMPLDIVHGGQDYDYVRLPVLYLSMNAAEAMLDTIYRGAIVPLVGYELLKLTRGSNDIWVSESLNVYPGEAMPVRSPFNGDWKTSSYIAAADSYAAYATNAPVNLTTYPVLRTMVASFMQAYIALTNTFSLADNWRSWPAGLIMGGYPVLTDGSDTVTGFATELFFKPGDKPYILGQEYTVIATPDGTHVVLDKPVPAYDGYVVAILGNSLVLGNMYGGGTISGFTHEPVYRGGIEAGFNQSFFFSMDMGKARATVINDTSGKQYLAVAAEVVEQRSWNMWQLPDLPNQGRDYIFQPPNYQAFAGIDIDAPTAPFKHIGYRNIVNSKLYSIGEIGNPLDITTGQADTSKQSASLVKSDLIRRSNKKGELILAALVKTATTVYATRETTYAYTLWYGGLRLDNVNGIHGESMLYPLIDDVQDLKQLKLLKTT